jgi:hypothetical protein
MFERQIQQESGFNPAAFNAGSGATGIAQIIPRFHPDVDPHDPLASLDYASRWIAQLRDQFGGSYARAFAAYNWGPGNVQGWDGRRATLPAETQHYLDVILGPSWDQAGPAPKVTYNRLEPPIAQNDSWSCAPTSTRWALTALGRHPSESWMEAQMLADGIVTREQGLSDASGQQLAAWIKTQYGEYGYDSSAENPISWEALAAEFMSPSNPYPALIGGRAWNHWVGLRTYDPASDRLLLANPAEGWMGIGQTMSRDDFQRLGTFSMVRVLHPDLLGTTEPAPDPVPVPPAPKDDPRALIAEVRALLDRLERAV